MYCILIIYPVLGPASLLEAARLVSFNNEETTKIINSLIAPSYKAPLCKSDLAAFNNESQSKSDDSVEDTDVEGGDAAAQAAAGLNVSLTAANALLNLSIQSTSKEQELK